MGAGRQTRMGIAAGTALALAAAMLLPSAAAAGRFEFMVIKPEASKKHRAEIFAAGDFASFDLRKKRRLASYGVDGETTERKMKAKFGSFGTVDVSFKRNGETKKVDVPKNCRGKPGKRFFGVAKGTIRFDGEGGYTRVHTKRARGYWEVSPKITDCKAGGARWIELFAFSDPVGFGSSVRTSGGKPKHSAHTFERKGKVSIFRFASARGPRFSYDEEYSKATVDPPTPFKGSAKFKAAPTTDEPGTFEGDLKLSFLGRKRVKLAGSGFEAFLGEVQMMRAAAARGAAALTHRGASAPAAGPAGR